MCKAADQNWLPVLEKGFCSDSNRSHFKVCSQNWSWMKFDARKPCLDLYWLVKLLSKDLKIFWAIWKIIIYCVTDQLFITRSSRSVLNFKFSVFTFLRSMSCSMSIEQNCVKRKTFNSNLSAIIIIITAITCIDKGSMLRILEYLVRIWQVLSGLDIQLDQSENYNPA